MKKIISIECYSPQQWGRNGWVFESLGTVFEHYAAGKIISPSYKKLAISYILPPKIKNDACSDEEIAYWSEVVDNSLMPTEKCDFRGACEKSFKPFSTGIKNSFLNLDLEGDYMEILRKMESTQFDFSGDLKKINKDWVMRWRKKIDIEYYFYNKKKGTEVPLFNSKSRSIMFKEFFSKFILENDTIKILRTKSDDYWVFDIKRNDVNYFSPRVEAGHAHSQYNLAKMYLEGNLVQENVGIAKILLKKSADQGFHRAEVLLEKLEKNQAKNHRAFAHSYRA